MKKIMIIFPFVFIMLAAFALAAEKGALDLKVGDERLCLQLRPKMPVQHHLQQRREVYLRQ